MADNTEPDNVVDFEAFKKRFLAETAGMDPRDLLSALGGLAHTQRSSRKPSLELPAPPATAMRFRVRVDLVGAKPPIWRRMTLPGDLTLDRVHDVLQVAFGWTNSHLHRFTPTHDRYGAASVGIVTQTDIDEGEDGVLETGVRLDQLLDRVGDSIFYTYDFGDDWEHKVVVESVDPLDAGDRSIRCIDGRRDGPPENVGGIHWYQHLEKVAANARHPEFGDLNDQIVALGLPSASGDLDLDAVNRGLDRLAGADETLTWLRETTSPVAELITGLNPETRLFLAGFVTDARLTEAIEPTDTEAERSTSVIRTFLEHVREGIKLTAAGFLPPAAVGAMMADLDTEKKWFGAANREVQTQPLLGLREIVTSIGLTRKYRGQLLLTERGVELCEAPVKLWHYVAEKLPVERSKHGQDIGILLMLIVAAGEAESWERLDETLDLMTAMVGWHFDRRGPFGFSEAMRSVHDTRKVLEWAGTGALVTRRSPADGFTEPGTRNLARAALSSWR